MLSNELLIKRDKRRRSKANSIIIKNTLRMVSKLALLILVVNCSFSLADSQFNLINNFNLTNLTLTSFPFLSSALIMKSIIRDIK